MEIEFDPAKDAINREKHGVSLTEATEFEPLYVHLDDRFDYGEPRYQAFGMLGDRRAVLVWTPRSGNVVRAISLRFAHEQERDQYERR